MNNQIRRELLNRHRQSGFPGSIMDVFSAYNAGRDIISEFIQEQQRQQQLQQMQQMQQQQSQPIVANTPEEQEQGLRPYHEAGQTGQSMVFPNIPANTPFNTVGMKAPINIDKYDNQGHLIESFKSVPPGIQNLPTGPQEGTVVETPANMQTGGVRRYQTGSSPDPDLAPGITQLPEAVIQTDRVPYSKISDNSRMMGVGWAKPFFEAAGNNPDSKLYKIGQKILDERKQDLDRAEMIMEFTSIPGFIRTAKRLEGKDPLKTIAKEGKIDLLSTLPLAGGIYKGLRLAEKGSKQAVKAAKYAATQTALRNTYKYNPWAFKTQKGKIYRQVGQAGFDDIITEGKVFNKGQKQFLEANPKINYLDEYNEAINKKGFNLKKPSPAPFFSKDELFFPIDRKATGIGNTKTKFSDAEYLFEGSVPEEALLPRYRDRYLKPAEATTNTFVLRPEYNDLSNFNLYKRDWLRGYRQINPLNKHK